MRLNTSASSDLSRFAFDGLLLVVTSALAGALYYLVHPLLARLMPQAEYTALVGLLALLKVLSVPSSGAQVVMARFVAQYTHENAVSGWVTIVKRATKKITIWGVVGLAVWVVLSPWLAKVLEAPSTMSLVMLGVVGFITLYVPIVHGTLQGARRFGWTAASGISISATRVLFAAGVAWLGGTVSPVLGAVAASTAVGLLCGCIPFGPIVSRTPEVADLDTRPIYRYLWPVLAGMALLTLLTEADLILCNRLLSGEERDAYTRAAMVARMAIYLPLPIVIAMFPRAVVSDKRWIVFIPVLFTLVVGAGVALGLSVMAPLALKLIFDVEGALYVSLLRGYAWATLPLALCSILSHYLWAKNRTRCLFLLAPILIAYVGMLRFFQSEPHRLIATLAVAGSCAFIALLGGMLAGQPRHR